MSFSISVVKWPNQARNVYLLCFTSHNKRRMRITNDERKVDPIFWAVCQEIIYWINIIELSNEIEAATR